MIEGLRRAHVPACLYPMTLVTGQTLRSIVFRVTETNPKRRGCLRSATVWSWFVTGTARRDVVATRLSARRVTPVTSGVRVEPGRDRQRRAGARRTMTTGTVHLRVPRVIESHVEPRQARKPFELSRLRIRVTDRANRTTGIRELPRVTTATRRMTIASGHRRNGRTRLAPVTKQTRQTRVIVRPMLKFRVVEVVGNLHLLLRRSHVCV